ncbi:flavodoxin [uncultured Acetobacteroides sp.]|uniref:flavodoxin n=1 Tax=uncultured Acetobacteroides sp. TaxID=1760811 RepID=UPI0029F53C3C|nr:flavodoxin [uncultured Acetobacteroides sp.]
MKIKFILVALAGMLMVYSGAEAQSNTKSKRVLVAYFSHSGNTRVIAQYIQEISGGDLFEIVPVKQYPTDYNSVVDQAKKEINAGYKPALKSKLASIDRYDVIFIGSPNWWSTIAPPVSTFLSSFNFSGKTIIPFITHEGSRMGRSVIDIKKLCPQSTVLEGYACRGSNVKDAHDEVANWLQKINMVKK